MLFEDFKKVIPKIDFTNLPGKSAHLLAMPKFNKFPYRSLIPRDDSTLSAVVVLIVPDDKQRASVVLTIRSEKLINHSGQISFPGGRLEMDETPLEAALRETEEEIGINRNLITIVSQLSDFYVIPSNSVIKPFLAYLDFLPEFKINEAEVQEIILVDLDFLLNKDNLSNEEWEFKEFSAEVPHWKVHKEKNLWGATAMILSELLELFSEI